MADQAAAPARNRKMMIDSVRSSCQSALSCAVRTMRQCADCDPEDAMHKGVMDACREVITAASIAMQDCSYYGTSSASDAVESSTSAAAALRKCMKACASGKSDCGDCSASMTTTATACADAAKACEENAGIDSEETDAPAKPGGEMSMKRFDMDFAIDAKTGGVSFQVVKDSDRIVDYTDVKIVGYLSTFKGTTPQDRDGDYVEPGAFTKSLSDFRKNPVLLRDHINATAYLAGSFTKIEEDTKGLKVEGSLSNAPDCRDVRFKVAEGHLKTLSMGGVFQYGEDGKQIRAVRLFEGSLTPVPTNQDARFRVRALNEMESKFMKTPDNWPSFFDFLLAEKHLQNARGLADT